MNEPKRRSRLSLATITFLLAAGPLAGPAAAQERPAPALEVAAGALFFPDDATVTEPFIGGAARLYVTPRISIGPELAFVSGDSHSHLMITGNLTVDLLGGGRDRPLTPFIVVGAGWFRTNENFVDDDFSSNEGAFTAGAGVRGTIGKSVFVGAEARIGWELHIRLNALVGVKLR